MWLSAAIIKSHDTDVAVLGFKLSSDTDVAVRGIIQSHDTCVAVFDMLLCSWHVTSALRCQAFFLTQHRKRHINLSSIGKQLRNDVCEGLLEAHAFTGCDTVSAFSWLEKVKLLKLLMINDIFCAAMQQLGTMWKGSMCHLWLSTTIWDQCCPALNVWMWNKISRLLPYLHALIHQIQWENY